MPLPVFPTTPKPGRLEPYSEAWPAIEAQFDGIYRQVRQLTNRGIRAFALGWESVNVAQRDAIQTFFNKRKGKTERFDLTIPWLLLDDAGFEKGSSVEWDFLRAYSWIVAADDGVANGSPTWRRPGKLGSMYVEFDGVDDYFDLGDKFDFAGTAAFTIECWARMRPGGKVLEVRLVAKELVDANGRQGWFLSKTQVNRFYATRVLNGAESPVFSADNLETDRWYHLAFVYTGSVLRFYQDGVQQGADNPDTRLIVDHTGAARIGATVFDASRVFHGDIDEVRIWNVARTQQQIQDSMNVELVGNESGLVGYWRLNDFISATPADVRSAIAAARLTARNGTEISLRGLQKIPLFPGDTVQVSAYAKADQATGGIGDFALTVYDGADAQVQEFALGSTTFGTAYAKYSTLATVIAANAVYGRLRAFASSTATTGRLIYFDDLALDLTIPCRFAAERLDWRFKVPGFWDVVIPFEEAP